MNAQQQSVYDALTEATRQYSAIQPTYSLQAQENLLRSGDVYKATADREAQGMRLSREDEEPMNQAWAAMQDARKVAVALVKAHRDNDRLLRRHAAELAAQDTPAGPGSQTGGHTKKKRFRLF